MTDTQTDDPTVALSPLMQRGDAIVRVEDAVDMNGWHRIAYFSEATMGTEALEAMLRDDPPQVGQAAVGIDPNNRIRRGTIESVDADDPRLPVRIRDNAGGMWCHGWALLPEPSEPTAVDANDPEALRAEIERLTAEHQDFQARVVEVARDYGERHNLCSVLDTALGELGLTLKKEVSRQVTFTATVTYQVTATLAEHKDPAACLNDEDFIRASIVTRDILDRDWTDETVEIVDKTVEIDD